MISYPQTFVDKRIITYLLMLFNICLKKGITTPVNKS